MLNKNVIRKITFPIIWYVMYYNLLFFLIVPNIYKDILGQVGLILLYIIAFADSLARLLSKKEDITDKYSLLLLIAFLTNPLIYILAFYEHELIIIPYFASWDNLIVYGTGITVLIIGGLVTISGRLTLGRFGSGMLVIEDDHKLITNGIYRYIRHPIYSGGLPVGLGTALTFRGLIISIIALIYGFIVIYPRMKQEEWLLTKEFGDEYLSYMKRTKWLIPFIY